MAKHIGIVACSAEGAALCYRTICIEAGEKMGGYDHPEVSMHTHSLEKYMAGIRSGDWPAVAELMLDSAGKLARAGAEFLICPDNTIHEAMSLVEPRSRLPWLHIAHEVVRQAQKQGCRCLAVLGTRYLMEGRVYRNAAAEAGLAMQVPDEEQRRRIDRIIFEELVYGQVLPESRRHLDEVLAEMKALGCDAAVLGCTELPLLAEPATAPLPLLDSTRILARAALSEAIR